MYCHLMLTLLATRWDTKDSTSSYSMKPSEANIGRKTFHCLALLSRETVPTSAANNAQTTGELSTGYWGELQPKISVRPYKSLTLVLRQEH